MAISSPPFPTQLILISSLLALLTLSPTTADEGNVLLTGDVLPTDGQLSYLDNAFVMQGDCNLVLYHNKGNGFQSNTHGRGVNCTLTLNIFGQFIIKSGADGSTVWSSNPTVPAKPGKYAAVLGPDGQVGIYGPAVWSAPANGSTAGASDLAAELDNIPQARNVLFSSQTLYDNAKLASRDYTLVMQDDCNLALTKASAGGRVTWQSGTAGKGQNCYARLDHQGQLVVAADSSEILWASKPAGQTTGDYVLIMQINGQAVIYGPKGWSTSNGDLILSG